jgi:hypothetical protein
MINSKAVFSISFFANASGDEKHSHCEENLANVEFLCVDDPLWHLPVNLHVLSCVSQSPNYGTRHLHTFAALLRSQRMDSQVGVQVLGPLRVSPVNINTKP